MPEARGGARYTRAAFFQYGRLLHFIGVFRFLFHDPRKEVRDVGTSHAETGVRIAAFRALRELRFPGAAPAAIQALMEKTAEDLGPAGRDDTFGHGMIRPAEALKGLGLSK